MKTFERTEVILEIMVLFRRRSCRRETAGRWRSFLRTINKYREYETVALVAHRMLIRQFQLINGLILSVC